MDVRILKYNNYYNRIVKYETSIDGYMKYVIAAIFNANFKPGDDVTTQFIFNYDSALQDKGGDYVLVTSADESEISRWFIIDSVRLLNGQYKLTLRRDLIVDNLNVLLDAPCFIEKATLDSSNPLIFNKENMTFNQIKTSETLLKDKSGCAWIVGYAAKGSTMETQNIAAGTTKSYKTLNEFLNLWNSCKTIDGNVRFYDDSNTRITYRFSGTDNSSITYNVDIFPIQKTMNFSPEVYKRKAQVAYNIMKDFNFSEFYNLKSSLDSVMAYNGAILEDENGKLHRITISYSTDIIDTYVNVDVVGSLKSEMESCGFENPTFQTILQALKYTYTDEDYGYSGVTFTINDHSSLQDAPYDMFAIPYGDITINNKQCGNKELGLAIAGRISEQWGGANPKLYDIQLLPYCPLREYLLVDGSLSLTNAVNYTEVKDSDGNIKDYILWANTSTMRFTIPYTITIDDPKLTNECDMWRLSSPNYNGQFEFNAAKNGGVSYFNVDCEYKPYAPHIHIAPNFNLLYGQDFDDGRGLICSGDFSLTQTSDTFATYQRQNANYDAIFNRQIQNMEFTNKTQLTSDIISAASGALSGGVAAGAVYGGTAGVGLGLVSGIAGAADVAINQSLRNEALDYTKDLHGYQLGNIQALPNSITKISSLSPDFKLFPILEYYTCTETEKEALKQKLKYNGMTVMTIGTIRQYLRPTESYIKGKLIRLDNLHDEDFHYVNEIAAEVNKGIFIGGTT